MSNQPEALRLADLLDDVTCNTPHPAAAELRRLSMVNAELLEALTHVSDWFTAAGLDVPAVRHARAAIAQAEGKHDKR
jgi:hypothetical protein